MTIQQLEYFVGIVNNKGMNKAASAMHISQPSLSSAMAKLSEELGVKLFEVRGRDLHLTEAGKYFYKKAEKLLYDYEQLIFSTKQFGLKSASISIVADAIDFCQESIMVMRKRDPEINFYTYRELSVDKAKKKLDTGNATFWLSQSSSAGPNYISEFLYEEPYVLASNKTNRLSETSEVSLHALANQTFITVHPDSVHRHLAEKIFHEEQVYPNSIMEVNDPETCLVSVIVNQGVAFIPESVANSNRLEESHFHNLGAGYDVYTISEETACRKVYLIYKKDTVLSDQEQRFITLARELAAFIQLHHRFPQEGELT